MARTPRTPRSPRAADQAARDTRSNLPGTEAGQNGTDGANTEPALPEGGRRKRAGGTRRKRAGAVVNEGPPEMAPERLPCANAASLREETVQFLWNLRVPLCHTTLLVGPSEVGKSTVATVLAAAVTSGGRLPGGPGLAWPRSVLWYSAEESPTARITPRLRANGAVLARVYFPEVGRDGKSRARPRLPRDVAHVLELAKQVDAGLIVFDPITSYCEDGANPDHGTVARPVCEVLKDLAAAIEGVCLPIKHPKKYVPGGGPMDQVSGSKEWVNVPRSVLLCAPHPDDDSRCCLIPLKSSEAEVRAPAIAYRILSRDGLPVLVWEEETEHTKEELLEGSGSAAERDTLADAKAILIDRLGQGDQKSKEVLQWLLEAGIPVSTARKAKKLLRITSHTIGPTEARYHVWRAPEGGFAKPEA